MNDFFRNIYYSFPVQLLIISLKKHQLLLLFWALAFSVVTGHFGHDYGIPYLFLDPEYLDHTGYVSFVLVGIGFGMFYVSWNLNCYMLHSYRYPFMASFRKPMGVFFLNNSLIPLAFIITYILAVVRFQIQDEYAHYWTIVMSQVGFIGGFALVLLLTAFYFTFTNRDSHQVAAATDRRGSHYRRAVQGRYDAAPDVRRRVDFFFTHHLLLRHTREVGHYDQTMLSTIYRQHHWNALLAQTVVIALLWSIGFFMDSPYMQIPTAASSFLYASILTSFFGVIFYWAGGWGATAILAFLIGVNQFSRLDILGYQSRVYGLDYRKPVAYSVDRFKEMASPTHIRDDIQHFTTILEHWRDKNLARDPHHRKPKLVFINVSGGGLRAATFSTAVMQRADSLLGGALFDHTFMISGASGGIFGASYLRELYRLRQMGMDIQLHDRRFVYNISKDLLNPICVSMLSNDLFLACHRFQQDSFIYYKDRGYLFERKLSANTMHVLDGRIADYRQDEAMARIPLLIMHTEVMNDTRRFFISPQPISFLMRPVGKYTTNRNLEVDGIDFMRFFGRAGSQLTMLSALRMNATFPLIMPNSVLPTTPATYILDGGALDNIGYEPTFRVVQTFRDWINQNTDGVVIIQIRDGAKDDEGDIEVMSKESIFSKLTHPLGTIFYNHIGNENFVIDQKFGFLNEALRGKVQIINFEYIPERGGSRASLSFHLTEREKRDILAALDRPNNTTAFELLRAALR